MNLLLKRVSVLRLALVAGAFSAVVNLMTGIISYISVLAVMTPFAGLFRWAGVTRIDATFIVLYTALGFVYGFAIGALCTFFYNIWSVRIGGIIVTVDESD